MLISGKRYLVSLISLMAFLLVWNMSLQHTCDNDRENFNSPHFGTIEYPEVEQMPQHFCTLQEGRGPVRVEEGNFTLSELEQELRLVRTGGSWRPLGCRARSRVAVLVPYRNRKRELGIFLKHMHPFLQRQHLDYTIFLIEQSPISLFNKGAIVNAGFIEVSSRWHFNCYIIHDVDVLPEDDRILYKCGEHPRHLAHAASSLDYKLLWNTLFGGVVVFTSAQYRKVNGFSNAFFGWGGEDDDIGQRVLYHGYRILRYPLSIARFKVLEHPEAIHGNKGNFYFETGALRYKTDGLNSLHYDLQHYSQKPLFTHFVIGLNETEIMQPIEKLYRYRLMESLSYSGRRTAVLAVFIVVLMMTFLVAIFARLYHRNSSSQKDLRSHFVFAR